MVNQPLLNSLGLLVLSTAATFFATRYWSGKAKRTSDDDRRAVEREAMKARVAELEAQIKGLSVSVQPLSAAFQAILVAKLTHFHTPEMDGLMRKLEPPTLTAEEEQRLYVLLEERTRDLNGRIDDAERNAATMLPMVMQMVKADLEAEKTMLQTVSITKPEEQKEAGG